VRGKLIADASLVEANASVHSIIERPKSDPEVRVFKSYEKK